MSPSLRSLLHSACSSEQIGLFHDAQKFLFVHLSISISVSFVNHFLQFLIGHPLPKFFSNSLQIFERNLASFVIIEQAEGLQNLLFLRFKAQGSHGNLQLLGIDLTTPISVEEV